MSRMIQLWIVYTTLDDRYQCIWEILLHINTASYSGMQFNSFDKKGISSIKWFEQFPVLLRICIEINTIIKHQKNKKKLYLFSRHISAVVSKGGIIALCLTVAALGGTKGAEWTSIDSRPTDVE